MIFIAIVALVSLVVQYGFELPSTSTYLPWLTAVNFFIAASFIGFTLFKLIIAKNKLHHIKRNPIEFIIILLLIIQLMFTRQIFQFLSPFLKNFSIYSITNLYIVLIQTYIVINLIIRLPMLNSKIANLRFPPSLILLGTFAAIIITGTFLLMLPRATHNGISFTDSDNSTNLDNYGS